MGLGKVFCDCRETPPRIDHETNGQSHRTDLLAAATLPSGLVTLSDRTRLLGTSQDSRDGFLIDDCRRQANKLHN